MTASTTNSSASTSAQPVLQIVLTMGQSLAVGTTYYKQVDDPTAMYPANVLGMNYGSAAPMNVGWQTTAVNKAAFQGFAPLVETVSETHVSGMLDALVSDYTAAGLTSPDFLNINASVGGYSIIQLMTSKNEVFASVQAGLGATTNGTLFAVPTSTSGYYDYYLNTNGTAFSYGSMNGGPGNWDNMVAELTQAVTYAKANGYQIAPTVVFNWMQGGADRAMPAGSYYYQYLLNQLINNVNSQVHSIVGSTENTLTVVNQISDRQGSSVPIAQLQEITSRADVIYGSSDFQYEMDYPNAPMDFIHTQPQGYFAYGQAIGHKIFDALQGHENTPILMSKVVQNSATQVTVTFSGVDSHLVSDASIFNSAYGLKAPSNMGFYAYDVNGSAATSFKVVSATIVGTNTVQLTFSSAITSAFRLYLGRTEDNEATNGSLPEYGGTTLRDATVINSLTPTSGTTISDPHIYDFAPDQYFTVTPTSTGAQVYTVSAFLAAYKGGTLAATASISDSSANVAANFDALQAPAAAGKFTGHRAHRQ